MSQQDIHELEVTIDEAKKMVDMGKSVERLRKNRDFKKVIEKSYLDQEAVRLVHLKSDPSMQSEELQRRLDRDIHAIGSFAQFLNNLMDKAEHAQYAINECQEELDAARAEDED